MNKRDTRYTPFQEEKYRMPVNQFCELYGLDKKVVMKRLNHGHWEDYEALVVPTNLGMTTPSQIRRALVLIDYNWTTKEIERRVDITPETIEAIKGMDECQKDIFRSMDNYFYLNPQKIDLNKIFKKAITNNADNGQHGKCNASTKHLSE